jgi:hypothetical protein
MHKFSTGSYTKGRVKAKKINEIFMKRNELKTKEAKLRKMEREIIAKIDALEKMIGGLDGV